MKILKNFCSKQKILQSEDHLSFDKNKKTQVNAEFRRENLSLEKCVEPEVGFL